MCSSKRIRGRITLFGNDVEITSVYDLAEWMDENSKVVMLGS